MSTERTPDAWALGNYSLEPAVTTDPDKAALWRYELDDEAVTPLYVLKPGERIVDTALPSA